MRNLFKYGGIAASIVQEDDPHLAKIFTREELLEMLRG